MTARAETSGTGAPPSAPAITYARATTSGYAAPAAVQTVQARTAARQTRVIRDQSGTTLVANDSSGFGLTRPYLEWNTYPTSQEATPPVTTSSGTFVSLHTCSAEPQHPKLRVRIIAVTGSGTTGEVRLLDRATGQVIAGPVAVAAASTLETNLDGVLVAPTLSGSGAPMKVDVQARVTGGASTIGVLVVHAMGKGS